MPACPFSPVLLPSRQRLGEVAAAQCSFLQEPGGPSRIPRGEVLICKPSSVATSIAIAREVDGHCNDQVHQRMRRGRHLVLGLLAGGLVLLMTCAFVFLSSLLGDCALEHSGYALECLHQLALWRNRKISVDALQEVATVVRQGLRIDVEEDSQEVARESGQMFEIFSLILLEDELCDRLVRLDEILQRATDIHLVADHTEAAKLVRAVQLRVSPSSVEEFQVHCRVPWRGWRSQGQRLPPSCLRTNRCSVNHRLTAQLMTLNTSIHAVWNACVEEGDQAFGSRYADVVRGGREERGDHGEKVRKLLEGLLGFDLGRNVVASA
ncbi:hypothetical protein KC360_g84 [Hortaea werneckii]|nr:hypothetical protein KC344_g81 [Hortaea werneckii]KAI7180427.1 hypothetical protein KC360_g84 [Hortaea werneckii]